VKNTKSLLIFLSVCCFGIFFALLVLVFQQFFEVEKKIIDGPLLFEGTTTYDKSTGEPADGIFLTYWDDEEESLHQVINFKNGLRHGPYKEYIGNTIKREYGYKKGLKHGAEKVYEIDDGRILETRHWRDGKKHGVEKFFSGNGSLFLDALWKNGNLDPKYKIYLGDKVLGEGDGLYPIGPCTGFDCCIVGAKSKIKFMEASECEGLELKNFRYRLYE
tara:strand:+ start:4153 stop:4806 length:654 start_codon:yes stop_codon:yes gene_type:complete